MPQNGSELHGCDKVTHGGHAPWVITGGFADRCDWRLPTNAELQTILLAPFLCGTSPCINQTIFGPTQPDFYWSSTTSAGFPASAWSVDFTNGGVNFGGKTFLGYARAVRGGL